MFRGLKTLTFPRGGVRPPGHKERTERLPLAVSPPPERVELLMLQHVGAPANPVVKKGDPVKKGQLVGEADGAVSARVHSSISGVVVGIELRTHNPTGRLMLAVIVESDGKDEWASGCNEPQDVEQMNAGRMRELVREAGVVGMGGAGFPAHVKLSPPPETPIADVIINGAECEPYLTSDYRLLVERTEDIVDASQLIMRIVGAKRGHVAVEANKPDAIEKLRSVCGSAREVSIHALKVRYPQGAEQQIISAVTGREVPGRGGLPADVGCLVHNVATALAVRDAIRFRKPLIERPLTATGDGIENPGNFVERIGTDIGSILVRQGVRPGANLLVVGGPMMGVAQARDDMPLLKGNSGIVLRVAEPAPVQRSCIRCGRCVAHCPLGLMPGELGQVADRMEWDVAEKLGIMECRECGCCAYVCPAKRQIVHMIRLGKAEIGRKRQQEKK